MANDTRSSRKAKDQDNGRHSDEKGSASVSGSAGLRRSGRETPSKKVVHSPSNTRKSERLEKKTPPTLAVRRKCVKVEKQNASNTLRRSERTKNQASLNSSESKSSGLYSNQNKPRKEKSVKKLIEAKEVSRNEKHNVGTSQVESQRMNARAFRKMFKVKAKKDFPKQLSGVSQSTKKGSNDDEGKIDEENQAQSKENLVNPDIKWVKESLEVNSREELVQLGQKSGGTNEARMSKNLNCEEDSENGNHARLPSDDAETEEMRVDSCLNGHVNESIEINRGVELSFTAWKCNSGIGSESDGGNCMEVSKGGSLSHVPSRTHKTSEVPEMVQADFCEKEKLQMVMSRNSTADGNLVRNNVGPERSEKLKSSKRKGIVVDMHSNVADKTTDEDNYNVIADATSSRPCECKSGNIVGTSGTCPKRTRVDHDPTVQESFSCNSKSNEESVNDSANKDRGDAEASITAGVTEKGMEDVLQKDSSANILTDVHIKICLICKRGGQLLYCGGSGCNRCYHFSCLEPHIVDAPLGVWLCPFCVGKKMELGVYAVSEGVESIWDVREVEVSSVHAPGVMTEKQFLVKYKGLAHVHNRWVPESQLAAEAPLLLVKFNKKDQVLSWKQEWTLPHRLLQKRALITAKQHDDHGNVHDVDYFNCRFEWLVKWRDLGYDQASWELDNAAFLCSYEGQSLIRDYEDRHKRAKKVSLFAKGDKKLDWGSSACKLSQMPSGISSGFGNNNLDAVNRLREYWHKGQNAIVIDDHDRLVKVSAFILSLQHDAYRPFLIISSSTALHLWEDDFSRLAPSVDVVMYTGNKEIRKIIRRLEFYGEEGCILFQVLIVAPEVIIEDLDVLGAIGWELIIVDECQYSHMSSYFQQFKMLNTDMRLLLFSGQLKDSIVEHLKILSFLDDQNDNTKDDGLNTCDSISQLKERLSNYIAYKCKPDSFRFAEYWVPVQISNVQLEQYCATLLSNSSILRSLSKNDLSGALHDVLISSRKCCSHPYIVDPSLQTLLTKGLQAVEYLDVGIKASGKLQVLDLMLIDLKKQGLRGLVLFQSIGGSGRDPIGDILDDFLRQRFGPDSYERVDKGVLQSKKLAALRMFNNKDSGRFVFLLETCACSPSIKLSSIDVIIIFNSDWSPMNDIRFLQRITLDSQSGQIKIFRLYSTSTVEEKALILAKQDKILDSNVQNISRGISHMMLMWGASCLFDDLKVFHDDQTTSSCLISVSGELLLKVVREFSTVLSLDIEDYTSSTPILLKVQQCGHFYRTRFPLLGEQKIGLPDEGPPNIFWTKLLEGKHPQWKYLCSSSQRCRKRPQHFDGSVDRLDIESGEIMKKNRKGTNNVGEPPSKADGEGKLFTGDKEGNSGDRLDQISERPQGYDVESGKVRKLHDEQRNLHHLLKPEIAKLCDILFLPDNVKILVDNFLEYVMNNHHIDQESESILQAFQISLCWTASSLLKHKIDHKISLVLAKQHLNFHCKKEEADYIYSKLRCLKKVFLYRTGNFNTIGSPKASELLNRLYSYTGKDPELELAKIDIYKSKKGIQHKCQKQLKKVLLKQQQEKEMLKADLEKEKATCENKYKIESAVIRSFLSNDALRIEKMKNLNKEYAERIEELNCKHEMRLKDLEALHLAVRQKFEEMEAAWVNDVESWAQDQLLNVLPSKELGTGLDYIQTSEQAESEDALKDVGDHVADGQSFDKMVEMMPGTGVGSCLAPETPSSVLCGNPDELQAPLVMHSCGNEVHPVASDGQGNIMSLHSCSKEQNFEEPIRMSNNEEGHDRFSTDGCREDSLTLVQPSSDGEVCHGMTSDVPGGHMAVSVHRAGSSNGDLDEIPSSEKETISSMPDCGSLPGEVEGVSSSGGVKNFASLNSQSSTEHIANRTVRCMLSSENAAQTHEADGSIVSNNAVTLNSPLFEARVADGSIAMRDPCTSSFTSSRMVDDNAMNGEIQDPNPRDLPVRSSIDIVLDNQSNHESLFKEPLQRGQLLTSAESPLNPNISGILQDPSHQVEPASTPVGIPTNQSNFDAPVGVPLEPVQPQLSAQSYSSNQYGAGEMQDSSQDEQVSSQGDRQGDKSRNGPLVAEPLEQVQQLLSAQPHTANRDTAVQTQESVSTPVDTVQSSQPNNESLVLELPLQRLQLLPMAQSPSSNQGPSNSPLATGFEGQPSNEDSWSCHVPQVSVGVPNQATLQPVSNSEPVLHDPVGRHIMQSSDTRNMSTPSEIINHPIRTATQATFRIPLPMYSDPLKIELERIRKEREQTIKNHKDMILQLKSDCEKEIAEIRKKYDIKMQQSEDEFQQKRKNLDASQNIVLMNKILAEAFRSKCMDLRAASASGMQSDASLSQQLVRLSRQETAARPSLVAGPSSGPHAPGLQITSAVPSSHTMVPPTQAPYNALGRSSNVSSRPPLINPLSPPPANARVSSETRASAPHLQPSRATTRPYINPISPPTANALVNSEIRAPAPHLQPYRPSTAMPAASPPILLKGGSSPQVLSNIPTTSASFPQLPPRLVLPTHQSDPHDRGNRPQSAGVLPATNLSPCESSADGNRQNGLNLPNVQPGPPDLALQNQSDSGTNGTMQANLVRQSTSPELVCLSDDE